MSTGTDTANIDINRIHVYMPLVSRCIACAVTVPEINRYTRLRTGIIDSLLKRYAPTDNAIEVSNDRLHSTGIPYRGTNPSRAAIGFMNHN
jgi:hypothetical protein